MRSRQPLVGQVRVPEPVQSGSPEHCDACIQSFRRRVVATDAAACGRYHASEGPTTAVNSVARAMKSTCPPRRRRAPAKPASPPAHTVPSLESASRPAMVAMGRRPNSTFVKVVAIDRPRGCRKQCKGSRALRQSDRWRLKKQAPQIQGDVPRRRRDAQDCRTCGAGTGPPP
jgi:hypothetical protein